MSWTPERIQAWCKCQHPTRTVREKCPLHGEYIVQWVTFRREETLLASEFEPTGLSFSTDEYERPEALERAEYELASIRRYDGRSSLQCEYQLRYRLIGPWVAAHA